MCEADFNQLLTREFLEEVEGMYGKIGAIVNAKGLAAHGQEYHCEATVVPFSPYFKGGRDRDVKIAARIAQEAWDDDAGVAPHCNQTFHRGIVGFIAMCTVAFHSVPQDRMLTF